MIHNIINIILYIINKKKKCNYKIQVYIMMFNYKCLNCNFISHKER